MSHPSNKIFENIKNKYEGLSYYTRYFKDIWLALIIISIILITVVYLYIKIKIKVIKKDWPTQRCNPIYIPFAGLIHKFEGKSAIESGQINFIHCQNNILNQIASKFFSPIEYLLNIITNVFGLLLDAINNIRNMLQYIRQRVAEITKPLILKIAEALNPLIVILIYLKDIFAKSVGILKTVLYGIFTYIFTLISIILNFYKIVRNIMLVTLASTVAIWIVIAILFSLPFGIGAPFAIAAITFAAIPATVASIILIAFTIILSILTDKLFKKTNRPNPAPPLPDISESEKNLKSESEKYI